MLASLDWHALDESIQPCLGDSEIPILRRGSGDSCGWIAVLQFPGAVDPVGPPIRKWIA